MEITYILLDKGSVFFYVCLRFLFHPCLLYSIHFVFFTQNGDNYLQEELVYRVDPTMPGEGR